MSYITLSCLADDCNGEILIEDEYNSGVQVECPVCGARYEYEYDEDDFYNEREDMFDLLVTHLLIPVDRR